MLRTSKAWGGEENFKLFCWDLWSEILGMKLQNLTKRTESEFQNQAKSRRKMADTSRLLVKGTFNSEDGEIPR